MGCFRGRGVVQVPDLVFIKEGCVVRVTLGSHAIMYPCPNLFTAKPRAGFIIWYTIVQLYMSYSNTWYSCLWAQFGMLQCCLQCINIIPKINSFVHYFTSAHFIFLSWRCSPTRATASSFLITSLDHTQWRITVCRTPLDEWSARRRDLYLTTHNT